MISDLRMGSDERHVFSFVVGRRRGEAIEPVPLRQRPGPEFPPGLWAALGERILCRVAEPACLLPCRTGPERADLVSETWLNRED